MIVDSLDQRPGVKADPSLEDQIVAQDPKLLKVGGDGDRPLLLAELPFLFLAEGLRGGTVFSLGHRTIKA